MNEERDQTLNQLLTELDGFEGREGVLLLAATNRAEVCAPAPPLLPHNLMGTASTVQLLCRQARVKGALHELVH